MRWRLVDFLGLFFGGGGFFFIGSLPFSGAAGYPAGVNLTSPHVSGRESVAAWLRRLLPPDFWGHLRIEEDKALHGFRISMEGNVFVGIDCISGFEHEETRAMRRVE